MEFEVDQPVRCIRADAWLNERGEPAAGPGFEARCAVRDVCVAYDKLYLRLRGWQALFRADCFRPLADLAPRLALVDARGDLETV